jgi:dTDP-glucose 4,6-dehydratase
MLNLPKTVLITGGAGFIGHHVVNYFIRNSVWNVVSLDRLDYSGNLDRIHDILKDVDVSGRLKMVHHDLKAELNDYTKNLIGEVDFIIHLAASSHVDRSIENPLEFVMDNVVGTCNILNYARDCKKLERMIYFSTDEVFGPALPGINFDEYARYNSTNPYSASKAGGEELAVAFHNTYNLPVYISHTMNVFGERQHPEKFIPKCIKNIRDGETVTIHSDSSKTTPGSRFYIHAEDVADALRFILINIEIRHDLSGTGVKIPKFNIVGKQEIDNLYLAQSIADSMGKELKYEMVDFHSSRPGHDLRYSLDGNLLKSIGWEPKFTFNDKIKQVVDWTLQRPDWLIQ